MNQKRTVALLLCNFIALTVPGGLLPLLPLYAAELGASPALIGNFLAIAFAGTALGATGAGWWSSRWGKRRVLLAAAGVLGVPIIWGMGQVGSVNLLIGLTTMLWFLGGVVLTVVGILAGRSAEPHARGRVFGLIALSASLGGVAGSTLAGPVVSHWGYPTLMTLMAAIWAVQWVGILLLRDWAAADATEPERVAFVTTRNAAVPAPSNMPATGAFTWPFLLLFVAHFLTGTAFFAATMGRTLAMDAQGFNVAAVSIAAAVGSAVGIVVNPLMGYLSDRINRQLVLALTYVSASLALLFTASATTLVLFVLTAVLAVVSRASEAVAQALVTDLAASNAPDRQLSLLGTATWISGIVGYGVAGYAIQLMGLRSTMLIIMLLPLLAVVLLLELQRTRASAHSDTVHHHWLARLRAFRGRTAGA